MNLLAGSALPHLDILLPVGISFYTFIQIGFLVEVYNRQVGEIRFGHYLLFGSFFPCVTAGPIVLQKDMLPQLASARRATLDSTRIAVALTVFGIGLFKKLILADNIAPFADGVFDGAAAGVPVGAALAWIGALAYTLQLYFDFSAYSDMALGIGYLFGLELPLNFNSPLKACSLIDFWRRWHMSMTRFFTSYLYPPIAMPLTRRALQRSLGPHRALPGRDRPADRRDLRARRAMARRRLDLRRVRPDPRPGARGQPWLARGAPARAAAGRRLAADHGGGDRRAWCSSAPPTSPTALALLASMAGSGRSRRCMPPLSPRLGQILAAFARIAADATRR